MDRPILRAGTFSRGVFALLLGVGAGCLFSTDTRGLKCSKNSHCEAGQACVDNVCTVSSDATSAGETDGTDGGSTGGTGSTGGAS